MLREHSKYMKAHFRMISYGQDEESETFKKSYPASFQRYFFRFVKAISNKSGTRLNFNQIKRRFMKLPTAFLISAGVNKCTMHSQGDCPSGVDCPYVTMNQKVIITHKYNKKRMPKLSSLRSRPFYRDDCKSKLQDIFMTQDEQ
jgi:hypothetical protein